MDKWTEQVIADLPDLDQIVSEEPVSASSAKILAGPKNAAGIFSYAIFDVDGHKRVDADGTVEHGADGVNPLAAAAGKGLRVVKPREGNSASFPEYYIEAFFPIFEQGRPVAVVQVLMDQTDERKAIYFIASVAATVLLGFVLTASGIPAIAWYRGTIKQRESDRNIRYLAHHDILTGLANRARFMERIDVALSPVDGGDAHLAVFFVDIDHFKSINDTLGHDGGDFLLKTIADRVQAITRIEDLLVRYGGDEFVLLLSDIKGRADAEEFANRLHAAVNEPITYNNQEIFATLSIGVAFAPGDGTASERLLKSADLAVYKAKSDGRNCTKFFDPEMDVHLQARVELERMIRYALAQDGFELHYQPIFEMTDNSLSGFEALIRLRKPDGTLIPPLTFLPVAEDMRVIDKIGEWVMHEACRTAASWPDDLSIAINLSPSQFATGSVSELVESALQKSGLAPNRLEIEITETLLLGDTESVLADLQRIKALGVSIAMDDFGTGYSSLSYLWRFPFDKIKIDRSFMQVLDGTEHNAHTVVKTILALGRELNMHVTVEGVETSEQADFLRDSHGELAQGFFFGRPIPASEIAAEILSHRLPQLTKSAPAAKKRQKG